MAGLDAHKKPFPCAVGRSEKLLQSFKGFKGFTVSRVLRGLRV